MDDIKRLAHDEQGACVGGAHPLPKQSFARITRQRHDQIAVGIGPSSVILPAYICLSLLLMLQYLDLH